MAKQRKRRATMLTRVPPHRGPLILTGKAAAILPYQTPPETTLQLLAELRRIQAEIRRTMLLPDRILNGRSTPTASPIVYSVTVTSTS